MELNEKNQFENEDMSYENKKEYPQIKCGECPVATTNPKDKMDCYFCPFDKVDAFHSLHDCSHLSELVEKMAELLKEQQKQLEKYHEADIFLEVHGWKQKE